MYRAAAVGDSVMWGQGLAKNEKYVYLYINWLKQNGMEIELAQKDFKAHSGAIIGDYTDIGLRTFIEPILAEIRNMDLYANFYGEVPTNYPTILDQLQELENPENIDLLIINGGANDIGITTAADISSNDYEDSVEIMFEKLANTIPKLLKKATDTAPNAKIIYTGYYPGLSELSDLPTEEIVFALMLVSPIILGPPSILAYLLSLPKEEDIKRQVIRFHEYLLSSISQQIATFNKKNLNSVTFCPSGFTHNNATYAPENYVFELLESRNKEVDEKRKLFSEVIDRRIEKNHEFDFVFNRTSVNISYREYIRQYLQHIEKVKADGKLEEMIAEQEFSKRLTDNAYIFHPNKKGANQYFHQLKNYGLNTLDFSLKKHMSELSSQTQSLKKGLERFIDIDSFNIRQLSNLRIIHAISFEIEIIQPAKINPIITSTQNQGINLKRWTFKLYFGWDKEICLVNKVKNGRKRLFVGVVDMGNGRPMKDLEEIKILFPKEFIYTYLVNGSSANFLVKINFYVNGYSVASETINQNNLTIKGNNSYWLHALK